jgi:hypothetical protein
MQSFVSSILGIFDFNEEQESRRFGTKLNAQRTQIRFKLVCSHSFVKLSAAIGWVQALAEVNVFGSE